MRFPRLLFPLLLAAWPCPLLAQDEQVQLSPWHAAVRRGDPAEVQRLLKLGADVNERIKTNRPDKQTYRTSPFTNGATAVHIAAAQATAEVLDLLIKAKADVTLKDEWDCTPMYFAARRGDVAVIERLVKAGAKVNDPVEHWNDSAIAVAAAEGKVEAVKWLAKNGADVKSGRTPPLYSAIQNHDFDLAGWLLKNGADLKQRIIPNIRPGNFTPLGFAVTTRNTNGVAWLLKQGDDPLNPADNKDTLPWQQAVSQYEHTHDPEPKLKALAMLRAFIEGCSADQLGRMSALHDAVRLDLSADAKRLLERKVSVEAANRDGRTALHVAVIERKPALVELLVKNKADLNAVDKQGMTPLLHATHQACRREVVTTSQLGVGAGGIDHGVRGFFQEPKPIDFSQGKQVEGADETLRLLLKLGADPERSTPKGITPLHLAAMIEDPHLTLLFTGLGVSWGGGHITVGNATSWITWNGYHGLAVAEVLLDQKARVDVKTKMGLSPLDVAATAAIRERLKKAKARTALAGLAATVADGDLRAVRYHEGKDAVNELSVGGFTPLTWTLLHRQDEMVPVLLKKGADPAKRDAHGLSPVWLALSGNRLDLVAQLLAFGASAETPLGKEELPLACLRLRDYSLKEGTRPLAVAVYGRFAPSELLTRSGPTMSLLRLLLAFDADPNIALDEAGTTPLHYAAASGQVEAVRLLLANGAVRAAKDKDGKTALDRLGEGASAELRDLLRPGR